MPVFAFASPKDKNHHVALAGGRMGKKEKKNQTQKTKPTTQKTLKITLKFCTVPNDALDCRCQCFWFCRDTDEAQLDPSMLHVLQSQAGFLECLLLPGLAGAAVPYGRGGRVPGPGIHGENTNPA